MTITAYLICIACIWVGGAIGFVAGVTFERWSKESELE